MEEDILHRGICHWLTVEGQYFLRTPRNAQNLSLALRLIRKSGIHFCRLLESYLWDKNGNASRLLLEHGCRGTGDTLCGHDWEQCQQDMKRRHHLESFCYRCKWHNRLFERTPAGGKSHILSYHGQGPGDDGIYGSRGRLLPRPRDMRRNRSDHGLDKFLCRTVCTSGHR